MNRKACHVLHAFPSAQLQIVQMHVWEARSGQDPTVSPCCPLPKIAGNLELLETMAGTCVSLLSFPSCIKHKTEQWIACLCLSSRFFRHTWKDLWRKRSLLDKCHPVFNFHWHLNCAKWKGGTNEMELFFGWLPRIFIIDLCACSSSTVSARCIVSGIVRLVSSFLWSIVVISCKLFHRNPLCRSPMLWKQVISALSDFFAKISDKRLLPGESHCIRSSDPNSKSTLFQGIVTMSSIKDVRFLNWNSTGVCFFWFPSKKRSEAHGTKLETPSESSMSAFTTAIFQFLLEVSICIFPTSIAARFAPHKKNRYKISLHHAISIHFLAKKKIHFGSFGEMKVVISSGCVYALIWEE